ncbi:MAG: Tim44 domain-containing protein [Magnetococcales bacterium]|nr:Tim44 domain-containing protein [Magnetococcales bacterium]
MSSMIVGIFGVFLMLAEESEAKRMGGGSSIGARGSKGFSAPQPAAPRSGMNQSSSSFSTTRPGAAATGGMFGGMGSGLLGGIGGFMLGGFLGSMLFGGAGAGMGTGGGIGLLEILLIGGLLWFAIRWFKRQRSLAPAGGVDLQRGGEGVLRSGHDLSRHARSNDGMNSEVVRGGQGLPQTFDIGGASQEVDAVSQGLQHIASMDPGFDEGRFLNGARIAFQQMQKSWCEGNLDSLRPLLTQAMFERIQGDLQARQNAALNDVIENIQFQKAQISEAWQESGEDWITVHLLVSMIEYSTDSRGTVVEGNRSLPVTIEEFWTFTRPVGSKNPNWALAAIQQPGQGGEEN